jgi:hypothetical protein
MMGRGRRRARRRIEAFLLILAFHMDFIAYDVLELDHSVGNIPIYQYTPFSSLLALHPSSRISNWNFI